jgi:protein-ribulosamine 3-kinase
MMNESLQSLFASILEKHTGQPEKIEKFSSLSGGSINNALRVKTGSGTWFAKYNSADRYPGMFEKEALGLDLLHNAREVYTPAVIGCENAHGQSMLVLEYVESARENATYWHDFGTSLAHLHKHIGERFGLDHDNYIGSLEQFNDFHDRWIDFFVNQRLEVQIKMARNQGLIDNGTVKRFEKLYHHLSDFFPEEKPSLIHGDLWSGNYMTNSRGEACIIDPAVYYGHRLMDIGMSKLFGGFAPQFYESYNNEFPMENNWRQAVEIANLYPLMVHVNLFGGGYLGGVMEVLKRV